MTTNRKAVEPADYTKMTQLERRAMRERYVVEQGGLCMHCQGDLKEAPPKRITDKLINWKRFPPNFLQHPVHLQHNHETGMTEGAVHAYCNAVMWQYESR